MGQNRGARLTALVVATLGLFGTAGTASAATVTFDHSSRFFPAWHFRGSPGEANHLTVSSGPLPTSGDWRIIFRDPGHVILPDQSASEEDRQLTLDVCVFMVDTVSCSNYYNNSMIVELGDRDDSLRFAPGSTNANEYTIGVDGGSGDDVLRGGWATRTQVQLNGGTGNDRLLGDNSTLMYGGEGADTMSLLDPEATSTASLVTYDDFTDRTSGVDVTLDGVANDGASNERDNVDPRIGTVSGTVFDDSFTGNALPGGHTFNGSSGNDRFDPAGGTGALNGADGDDTFVARDGTAQTITCAAGIDSVVADAFDTLSSCETVDQQ